MAVRTRSIRHLRWRAFTALSRALPGLAARMPMYPDMVPAESLFPAEVLAHQAPLPVTDADRPFLDALTLPLAPSLDRRTALVPMTGVSLLGSTGTVIDETRKLALGFRHIRDFVTYHTFRPALSRRVEHPDETALPMIGSYEGHKHFFHFLIDRLPRLWWLGTQFGWGDRPVTVLTNTGLPAFQQACYRAALEWYPGWTLRAVPSTERSVSGRLLAVDNWQSVKSTLMDPGALDFVRRVTRSAADLPDPPPGTPGDLKLYITRTDARKRRLTNEAEVAALLQAKGFAVVEAAKLSFSEQVRLFSQARLIVGAHGAGMTNLIHAAPGATIVELFARNKVKDTYFWLSRSMGQTYLPLIGGMGDRLENFFIDPAEVDAATPAE